MELSQFINNLEKLVNNYDAEIRLIVDEVALNAIALIIRRIQQTGLSGGRRYSTNKLPTFYFYNRALNAGGRQLLNRHRKKDFRDALRRAGENVRRNSRLDDMEDGISYEEWRRANGLQTSFVDLTYSGKMFREKNSSYQGITEYALINIIERYRTSGEFSTTIGALDKETEDKLRWNKERFGDFLAVTEPEKAVLEKLFETRLRGLYRFYGFT